MNGKLLTLLLSSLMFLQCGNEPAHQSAQPTPAPAPAAQPQPQKQPEPAAQPAPVIPPPAEETFIGGNQLPRLKGARFLSVTGGGLKLEVETEDADQDPVKLKYSWKVNDEFISDTDSIGPVKKGDSVEVSVTPNDGKDDGKSDTISMIVKNTPPSVQKNENIQFNSEGLMTYQIQASDPDADPLVYSLVKAPPGMVIDSQSGLVSWDTKDVANGEYSATIGINDGTSSQVYTFQVNLTRERE